MAYDTKGSEEEDRRLNERKTSPMLNIALQLWLIHFTTDETFGIENRVGRVHVERIFGRVTDPSFEVRARLKEQRHGKERTVAPRL
jgi:hypothetical protein